MWILTLIMLNALGEPVNVIPLVGPGIPVFKSFEECTLEETRIGGEMKKAYPNEKDYAVQCLFVKPTKVIA